MDGGAPTAAEILAAANMHASTGKTGVPTAKQTADYVRLLRAAGGVGSAPATTYGIQEGQRTSNQVNDLYSPMPRAPVAPVAPTAPRPATPAPAPAPVNSAPRSRHLRRVGRVQHRRSEHNRFHYMQHYTLVVWSGSSALTLTETPSRVTRRRTPRIFALLAASA